MWATLIVVALRDLLFGPALPELIALSRRQMATLQEVQLVLRERLATIQAMEAHHSAQLEQILEQGALLMAFAQDTQTLIQHLAQETDNIGARIQNLEGRLQGNPTEEEKSAILTQLGQLRARLSVLGSDPNNPIPGGPISADPNQPIPA